MIKIANAADIFIAIAITASGIVFFNFVISEKKKDVGTLKSKVSLRPYLFV